MTRLFRALRSFILYPVPDRSMSTREAGKLGSSIRYARERERYKAKARQMLAEMGLPEDPRLGAA